MRLTAIFAALITAGPAFAEGGQSASTAHQPYSELTARAVKALSPEEVDALLSGKGFSQALAAELNGYPGPRHVLDLGRELGLTAGQKTQVEALFAEMQREAIALGQDIVEAETRLDRAFASGDIDEATLVEQSEAIGRLRGLLRATHLRYHLRTKTILTPHQVSLYDRLRGYGAGRHGGHAHP